MILATIQRPAARCIALASALLLGTPSSEYAAQNFTGTAPTDYKTVTDEDVNNNLDTLKGINPGNPEVLQNAVAAQSLATKNVSSAATKDDSKKAVVTVPDVLGHNSNITGQICIVPSGTSSASSSYVLKGPHRSFQGTGRLCFYDQPGGKYTVVSNDCRVNSVDSCAGEASLPAPGELVICTKSTYNEVPNDIGDVDVQNRLLNFNLVCNAAAGTAPEPLNNGSTECNGGTGCNPNQRCSGGVCCESSPVRMTYVAAVSMCIADAQLYRPTGSGCEFNGQCGSDSCSSGLCK